MCFGSDKAAIFLTPPFPLITKLKLVSSLLNEQTQGQNRFLFEVVTLNFVLGARVLGRVGEYIDLPTSQIYPLTKPLAYHPSPGHSTPTYSYLPM